MTTTDIANKLVEYCSKGEWNKAQEELYSQNAVSIEPEHSQVPVVKGLDAIKAKGEQWGAMVEEFYGVKISSPIIAGNHFSCTMNMDIKMKDAPRKNDEEVCVFRVENGQIVSEQFFY